MFIMVGEPPSSRVEGNLDSRVEGPLDSRVQGPLDSVYFLNLLSIECTSQARLDMIFISLLALELVDYGWLCLETYPVKYQLKGNVCFKLVNVQRRGNCYSQGLYCLYIKTHQQIDSRQDTWSFESKQAPAPALACTLKLIENLQQLEDCS